MTTIPEEVAKTLVQRLIDGAIGEVNYLCCFRTHVANFEKKRKILVAQKKKVLKDIEDAKKRNETQVEDDVLLWLDDTNEIIDEDTKTNMKCFHGWRPNCIWQYKQGKKFAEKIPDITDLIERCNNFDKVARLVQPPGITYYSPQNFIDFDSRKSKFKNLVDILQGGSYSLIGLHGLGGTGKTTLATKVGQQVEESKAFQKVIFVVVSNPPDINKIRKQIASQLELQLEEGKEEEHSVFLWARIANYEGKVLIILDDTWQWLDLKDIGIPYGQNHKNCCVLITTRDSKVCEEMDCQQKVALQTLTDDDALNLFIKQFDERSEKSSCEFMDLAGGISKECEGLPLVVVAVATILKGWPLRDWKSALKTLQKSEPLRNVHKDLVKVYRSLKLSYDNLEKKAQYFLLLCSIFPEDFEIPIELLSKLGIGLGLFGGVNSYFGVRRREAIAVKNDLINSYMLLEADKVHVKMHDLVREVALWIADENVQVIINSSATIKSNLQFLFWRNDDFPNCFEATKLEVLIIDIVGEAKVTDATIFEGMANLKVLFLEGPYSESFTPSLGSLLSLKNIRTLIFRYWKLGDISILKDLKLLETFELENCTITELSEGFSELKSLKLLGFRWCHIEKGNPFEVIERCSQLEELYFLENFDAEHSKLAENTNAVSQDICRPILQRYSIACSGFEYFFDDDDDGLLNCFNTEHARELISESMFEDLMGRAEVLEFRETGEAQWKNFVHGTMMNDLIKLCLCDLADIQCLIDRDTPAGSFRQLQILKLKNCKKLQHLCFDGNLKLPYLKSLHLEDCPMLDPSIFQLHPSVALCTERLEELIIRNCNELRSLITFESLEEENIVNTDQQKSYFSTIFQKLKSLKISNCGKLELLLPLFSAGEFPLLEDLNVRDCKEMKYIFGKYREVGHSLNQHTIVNSLTRRIVLGELPSFIGIVGECKICTQRPSCAIVKDDSKEKQAIPFSRAFGCCFLPTIKDVDIEVSNSSSQNLEVTKESYRASSKRIETFHTAECLIRQPLSLQYIREMRLWGCSKLKSLFCVSIATTIMLEMLEIKNCEELKHIITNDEEDDDHLNYTSIFPKLERLYVFNCHNLEFIFPSTHSGGLQNLQIMKIEGVHLLKHVFGAYNKKLQHMCFDGNLKLPHLKSLHLEDCPMLDPSIFQLHPSVSLCIERLEELIIRNCNELRSLITYESLEEENIVNADQQKSYFSAIFQKLKSLEILNCGKLELLLPLFSAGEFPLLEDLNVRDCKEMKYIFGKYREVGHSLNQHTIFPSLTRRIVLGELPSFIGIIGECKICTQRPSCAIVKDDSKEKQAIPFSRAFGCCFLPTIKDVDIEVSNSSSQNLEVTKESYRASSKRIETFHTAECLIRQPLSLQYIREMRLWGCSKLKSLFCVSIATTIMLEMLEIKNCEELKHIITNDEERDNHLRHTSIFPKLQRLFVFNCHDLEFIFPSTLSGGLNKLQIMEIKGAHQLKYVFGAYNEDQNINVVPINLPALKTLARTSVPEIISLCTNSYYVVWPPLQHITLDNCWSVIKSNVPDFMAYRRRRQLELNIGKGLITGSSLFPDFMICLSRRSNMETFEDYMISLAVRRSETIEEIFNVEGIQSEGPVTLSLQEMKLEDLDELRHVYKDPNNILRFLNLKVLRIKGCGKLRALFTTSTAKSLPRLSSLEVIYCNELVNIIEEDDNDKTSAYGGGSHQLCFPTLKSIEIRCCDGLRSLFSISTTSIMFPNLKTLIIVAASRLEEAFKCQQYDTQEISIQNVFPNLSTLTLHCLTELRTICRGINFHSVPNFQVIACPKYTENKSPTDELQPTDCDFDQAKSDMGEANLEQEIETQELATSVSPNFTETEGSETGKEAAWLSLAITSSNIESNIESIPEDTTTVKGKINTPPIYSSQAEGLQTYPPTQDLMKAKSRRETIMTHQQELEEITTENAVEGLSKYSEIMKTSMITTSTLLINGQPRTEQDLVDQLDSGEATSGIKGPHQANIPIMEEAVEQSYQEQDGSKEVITRRNSNKGLHYFLEPGKEYVGMVTASNSTTASTNSKGAETGKEAVGTFLTSWLSMATTSSNVESIIESIPEDPTTMKGKRSTPPIYSQAEGLQTYPPAQVTPSIEETLEQGPQQNYAAEEVTIANKSVDLDPKKQSVDLISRSISLLEEEKAKTNKETRDASDLEGHKAEKGTEANLSTQSQIYSPNTTDHNTILTDVIPPLQHEPEIAVPSSSSPTLDTGEIFKLVELKESEHALLTDALERYPKLKLPRERRTNRIIALSYRVLVDILVMLTTKTPCTITSSDRSILEDNLGAATFLGFDNEWIESVRAKISGSDMLDVLAAEKEIKDMEVKLETCEMALDDVRKQSVEWIEAFDSQLFGLLEDSKKFVVKMEEIRGFMSSKDKPFGF